jgi:hypothetical protein
MSLYKFGRICNVIRHVLSSASYIFVCVSWRICDPIQCFRVSFGMDYSCEKKFVRDPQPPTGLEFEVDNDGTVIRDKDPIVKQRVFHGERDPLDSGRILDKDMVDEHVVRPVFGKRCVRVRVAMV